MCKAMEDMRNEAEKRKSVQIALRMLRAKKYSFDEIAEMTGLSADEVRELATEQSA